MPVGGKALIVKYFAIAGMWMLHSIDPDEIQVLNSRPFLYWYKFAAVFIVTISLLTSTNVFLELN